MELKLETEDGRPLIGNDRFEGYCVDLMQKIAEKADVVSYIFFLVKDGAWGQKAPNGSLKGMIGEVARGVCATLIIILK